MILIVKRSKIIIAVVLILLIILSTSIYLLKEPKTIKTFSENEEITNIINDIFSLRSKAILEKDVETLKSLYQTDIRYSLWAYEHELKKMKYLHMWSEKQDIKFQDIKSIVRIRYVKERENGYQVNFTASTEYKYVYNNEQDKENIFRIGTYHLMDIKKEVVENQYKLNLEEIEKSNINMVEDEKLKKLIEEKANVEKYRWIITKEWYTDPFADSLNLDNIKSEEVKEYISSHENRDMSNLNERRISAVKYADQYAGAAAEEEFGLDYNPDYKNYNPLGGDCANFASQILHEGGGFRKTGSWNYRNGGSKAWVNAHGFKDYMLNSGRASLIAKGSYQQVYKQSYKLLPGDFVAYEKKGKVKHISVVTGVDSKGYSLVNCHNTDRYRVPWDLGWSDKNIKFWLVRVHY